MEEVGNLRWSDLIQSYETFGELFTCVSNYKRLELLIREALRMVHHSRTSSNIA